MSIQYPVPGFEPTTFERESPPITIRPRLPPIQKNILRLPSDILTHFSLQAFPVSFSIFCLFYKQFKVNNGSIKAADDWIRTPDLWFRKQPLCQLSHNHCLNRVLSVGLFFISTQSSFAFLDTQMKEYQNDVEVSSNEIKICKNYFPVWSFKSIIFQQHESLGSKYLHSSKELRHYGDLHSL